MSSKTLLGAILVGFFVTQQCSPTDWAHVHDLTLGGIRHLYSLEIADAMQAFDSVSHIAPSDPRGPFFRSMVHFYLYGLNREEKELTTFLDMSDRVIDVCERLLEQNENDSNVKFYLGGIYGYRGLAYHTNGSYLKAAQNGRKGYLLLEEAVTQRPDLYDAQMGFGLFRYLLAKLPKSMRWILSLLGFEGDLEGGLAALRLAAEKGVYTRTEAKLFLAQFLFTEGRQDSALRYLNELRREYPTNTLFLVLYAFWQHRLDNLDEAMNAARMAIELNKKNNVQYGQELAYSTLGSIYFTRNDFAQAATYYKRYMAMTRSDDRTPNRTFYRAALACEMTGDRPAAVGLYSRMRKVDESAWDIQTYRRGQDLLTRPLTAAEIAIVKGENEFSQKNYTRAVEFYNEAVRLSADNVDIQARALYGLLQALTEASRLTDALDTAKRLVMLNPSVERWIIPSTWFRVGQIHARLGNPAEATLAFDRVKEYDDYEFQERLEDRVREEQAKLSYTK
jgi:tetratricopeptide (TPR) repeat protein